MGLDNLTIITTVHERQYNLKRIVEYYKDFECRRIIVDSSFKEYSFVKYLTDNGFEYFYYGTDRTIFEIMTDVFNNKVDTKFVLDCPDDDLVYKFSIKRCVKFLEKNRDYVSADGEYLSHKQVGSQVELNKWPNYGPAHFVQANQKPVDEEDAKSRVRFLMFNYYPKQHAVQTTESYRAFFNLINDHEESRIVKMLDRTHVIVSAIFGKSKVFYIPYMVRTKCSPPILMKNYLYAKLFPKENFIDEPFLEPFAKLLEKMDSSGESLEKLIKFLGDVIGKHQKKDLHLSPTEQNWTYNNKDFKKENAEICRLFHSDFMETFKEDLNADVPSVDVPEIVVKDTKVVKDPRILLDDGTNSPILNIRGTGPRILLDKKK